MHFASDVRGWKRSYRTPRWTLEEWSLNEHNGHISIYRVEGLNERLILQVWLDILYQTITMETEIIGIPRNWTVS